MALRDDALITLATMRSVLNEDDLCSYTSIKSIFDKLDFKLTETCSDQVYQHILNKVSQESTNFMSIDLFGDVLKELNIDNDKYGDILFNLLNGDNHEHCINIQQWTYFSTKRNMDLDDRKVNNHIYSHDDLQHIRNLFIYKVKQYQYYKLGILCSTLNIYVYMFLISLFWCILNRIK